MIEVRDLRVKLDKKLVLKDIDLFAGRGETLAIMGPSGCGKTTLLKCISGLLRPTSGEIYFNSEEISKLSEKKLNTIRRQLGLVFQYAALFDFLTVAENVAFGLERHSDLSKTQIKEAVTEKLTMVGLAGSEDLYPSQLSGGMRKRVGLARALALNPAALLYDEPTSGLDPVTAYAIDALINSMREQLGVTSIVVSHDVSSVFRIADKIIMLDEGVVTASGTPEEIKHSDHPQVRDFLRSAMAITLD